MSSSWRDGLAFCALIHRYRPDLLDFDKLGSEDWAGNCSLAFKTAETELDIPPLLDVEDVVKHDNPDKFSIMTYVAQFYHKFEDTSAEPDSGVCSLATSYTGSSEESTPKRAKCEDRKGAILSLMNVKKERPVSWHGRGRVELTVHTKPVENENPFTKENLAYHDEILKAFNKKYEVSEPVVARLKRKAKSESEKENKLSRTKLEDN